MAFYPLEVLVEVRRVDHEQEFRLADAVYEQVVDCSAVLVGHHAVEHLSVGHGCGVVGEYMVDKCCGIGAAYIDFAHM